MKVTDHCWIGMLVHNYEANRNILSDDLGFELERTDETREITMFRFPSGQSIEKFGPDFVIRILHSIQTSLLILLQPLSSIAIHLNSESTQERYLNIISSIN